MLVIVTGADAVEGEGGRARAAHAVQHGARLKRKLQRRLTRQALAEAKAIKEQIHVLVYVAELVRMFLIFLILERRLTVWMPASEYNRITCLHDARSIRLVIGADFV